MDIHLGQSTLRALLSGDDKAIIVIRGCIFPVVVMVEPVQSFPHRIAQSKPAPPLARAKPLFVVSIVDSIPCHSSGPSSSEVRSHG